MRSLKVMAMVLLVVAAAGLFAECAYALERTLTTLVLITVRPEIPEVQNAPAGAREVLDSAMPQSVNARFVSLESPVQTGLGVSRYTMMEKL